MNPTLNPFEKLLVGLAEANVEFITVGGMACVMNGYVRATEDVDILINKTSINIKKLLSFLSQYGEGFGAELTEADFNDEEGAIRVIEEFPIDIFVVMGGRHYEDLRKYVEIIRIHEHPISFLNPEGLVLLKSNSVREKDRIDVLHLRGLKKK